MKYIFILSLLLFSSVELLAQAPEKMSYQAVIRDNTNALVSNSNVNIKIIIHQGNPSGTNLYEENHFVSTNQNGLVSLEIGSGAAVFGDFSSILWYNSSYFLETQVDINGDSNFSLMGTTQLLSVPYALHAKTADTVINLPAPEPHRAEVFNFNSNRNIISTDVNNTIACTTSATLTLSSNFSSMEIGDTINLEAHNGAILTVVASNNVQLNYINNGTAQFASNAGNVRFGLLRKTASNAYIISGQ